MELTLHKKVFLLAGTALALIALAMAWLLLFDQEARPESRPEPTAESLATPGSSGAAFSAPRNAFRFLNQSSTWYWEPTEGCRQQLEGYLADFDIRSAEITLTDDTQGLLIGIHYPDLKAEQADARVNCSQRDLTQADRSDLICQVAISKGEPGPALDVAATVAVAFGIQDYFRPRNQGAWDGQKGRAWAWEDFQPLIEKENETWRSSCLSVAQR
jgi:hypothetical protein